VPEPRLFALKRRCSPLVQDFRYSLRFLAKHPGMSLAIIAILAVGFGFLSSALASVYTFLIQPLPFESPEQLVSIVGQQSTRPDEEWPISYPDFLELRDRSQSFASVSALTSIQKFSLRQEEGPELVDGTMVSADLFQTLGVQTILGRSFSPEEDDVSGSGNVVILSHEFWKTRLRGSPEAVGGTIHINETPFKVIGVLPPHADQLWQESHLWVPISMAITLNKQRIDSRKYRWLSAIARLRPDVSPDMARAELVALSRQMEQEYPDTNRDLSFRPRLLTESLRGGFKPILLMLLAGAALTILIVYSNVTGLVISQMLRRQSEVAIRIALGASRGQLFIQFLIEVLLLSLVGCALGLALSTTGSQWIARAAVSPSSALQGLSPSWLLMGTIVTTAALVATCLVVLSALFVSSRNPNAVLRGNSSKKFGTLSLGTQDLLVIAEVAISVLLLIGAALVAKGLHRLESFDLGFRPDNLLTVRLATQQEQYREDHALKNLVREATTAIKAVAGTESVAFAGPSMPTDDWHGITVTIEDKVNTSSERLFVLRHAVTPDYFKTLDIPLRRGRGFTDQDDEDAVFVVVVSNELAARAWPGENPIGKRLRLGVRDSFYPYPWLTVAGVVDNVRHQGWTDGDRPGPDLYLPFFQMVPHSPPVLNVIVRTSVPPQNVAAKVQGIFKTIAPGLPVHDAKTNA
jgi:putative ABC transport system permease protein